MRQDATQRRRIVAAVVFTVFAVPASYAIWGSDDSADSTGVGDGTATTVGEVGTDVMGTVPIGYLSGDDTGGDGEVPVIAIPRAPNSVNGYATFNRDIQGVSDCLVPRAPFNIELTLTNTDTGQRVACDNVLDPVDFADRYDTDQALLHVETFLALGDLTDAPIPIEVTW